MAAHNGFLGIASAACGQGASFGQISNQHTGSGLFRGCDHLFRGGNRASRITGGIERLAKLGAVTVERHGFEHGCPARHIGFLDRFEGGITWHVDGFTDSSADEGLSGGHHPDMGRGGDKSSS